MKKIILFILAVSFLFYGCSSGNYNSQVLNESDNENEQKQDMEEYTFLFEQTDQLNALEPEENILLGAYFPYNIEYGIEKYEQDLPKGMNHYVYEYILGTEFDTTFILDCISKNKIPFIKVIPNNYNKYDTNQIRSLSKILSTFNIGCYIELFPMPSDKQYDHTKYKEYFEESSSILKETNNDNSIIFSPNPNELFDSINFYPSSETYDFLGFNYIGSILNKNEYEYIYEDFFQKFDYVYSSKNITKPIFITTFALSYFSKIDSTYYLDENINYINEIIIKIKDNYKRVKGINFYDVDSRYQNFNGEVLHQDDYRLTENEKIRNNFYELIKDDLFLSEYEASEKLQKNSYMYDAILMDNNYYISSQVLNNKHIEQVQYNETIKTYNFYGNQYYELESLFKDNTNYNIEIDDINKKITVS